MPYRETLDFYTRNVIYLKILGFRAISIVDDKSVTKPLDLFFFLFGVGFGVSICYFTVVNKDRLTSSKSEIANYGNYISLIASICVSIISMILAFIGRHKLWKIVVNFAEVDEKVNKNYVKILNN